MKSAHWLTMAFWSFVWIGQSVTAQRDSATPQFDVASIKENRGTDTGGTMQPMPDGGIRSVHMPAVALVRYAYELANYQLAGVPDWARNTYYDINAKPAAQVTPQQTRAMFRGLLADRFKMTAHRESRAFDGFALVPSRSNSFGPNLKRSTVDCETDFASEPTCRQGIFIPGRLALIGRPIEGLRLIVEEFTNVPVVDETGISWNVDLDLRWTRDIAPSGDLPALPTALQEQLGLRLDKRRVAREVLVIDHLEKPTPD